MPVEVTGGRSSECFRSYPSALKVWPQTPDTTMGVLRKHLDDLGITAYIPVHPNQERNMVEKGGFDYRGDHLVCPEGKNTA